MPPVDGAETAEATSSVAAEAGKDQGDNPIAFPERLAVIGAGLMGTQIACVLARGADGVVPRVALMSRRQNSLDAARRQAERYATQLARNGLLPISAETLLERLWFTTDLDAAAEGAGFVVESIVEVPAAKQAVFQRLDALLPAHVVLATNTSALPVAECAGPHLRHPERMLVSHFLQPAHIVPVVEVVLGPQTSAAAASYARSLWRALGHLPVTMLRDEPGFLINRLQHALVREAVRLVADGLASAEDVDAAIQFGLAPRFVMAGPLRQRDINGLAMHIRVARRLWPELDTSDGAATAIGFLTRLVDGGALGLENGRGFFDWHGADPVAMREAADDCLIQLTRQASTMRRPWDEPAGSR